MMEAASLCHQHDKGFAQINGEGKERWTIRGHGMGSDTTK